MLRQNCRREGQITGADAAHTCALAHVLCFGQADGDLSGLHPEVFQRRFPTDGSQRQCLDYHHRALSLSMKAAPRNRAAPLLTPLTDRAAHFR